MRRPGLGRAGSGPPCRRGSGTRPVRPWRRARRRSRGAREPYARYGSTGPGRALSHLRVGGRPVVDSIHAGDCGTVGTHTKPLSRDEARHALTAGGIRACDICRPETDLGILD
ncbi:DUF6233 domain-containing protein [Streptomyces lateritius]|uniref:DUF6233 domain-containing protein n=1 Tax=Streptomyces lateritius TaxID=67313 RepID=UPI00227D70AE|nr:DUF6233 domain-containing protein [Streptomyces lateritius]